MNHENLINALKDRFTDESGMIAVKDVELLIWTATTVNAGRVVNPTPYVSIVLRRDDQMWIERRKIAAIKGVRQMSLDLTGTTWGLKQAKDAVDCAENAPFVLFEEVPLAEASVACVKYNAERTGWVASH
jgi:ribosomal protein L7/L12